MTYSPGLFVPGRIPTTLREDRRLIALVRLTEARVLSGTALKPFRFAAAERAARSWPEAANRRCAAGLVSQPITFDWSICPPGSSRLYCGPVQEDCTTFHPYEAGAGSWTIKAPAAPCRAASSYL